MKQIDSSSIRKKNNQIDCPHIYHYTVKNLFLKNGVMGKKQCERCGETIVLDKKSKIKVITYAILMAAVIVVILKTEPDFLVGNTHDERMMIAMPLMLTAYIVGLFLVLRHVSFETYKPMFKDREHRL